MADKTMVDRPTTDDIAVTHKLHNLYLKRWNLYLRSYEGGKDYTDPETGEEEYLEQHAREGEDDYADRKSRACYFNFCRPIIDTYINHLSKTPPKRIYDEDFDEDYLDFLNNVNFRDTEIDSFVFDQLTPMAQIAGIAWICPVPKSRF
jgi:hypothetical protein